MNFTARLSWGWLSLWAILAVFGAFLLPSTVLDLELTRALKWGYDPYGRNVFWVTLRASALSLGFAAIATVFSLVTSLFLGCGMTLLPSRLQAVGNYALNLILAFPYILFALGLAVLRGPGWGTLLFALLIANTPSLIRFVFLRAKEIQLEEFTVASLAMGASRYHLIRVHLMPSALRLVLVKLPSLFASSLLAETSLSFLGLGAPPGSLSWGSLLAMGKDFLLEAPHIALLSGLPLTFTILSFQIISEGFESGFSKSAKR